ncbi:hypothetical protein CN200_16335 [Sinorhizobium meliloti]|uniref:hypothetical protein n=1 Tax=Rhizobium meliloti TaxID=382 RepID=UPI000FD30012|nr:hypothetical protein [Sinorhizobium meliloti]RVI16114.1 hypothetical protein CN200_16335 [Sinorhizobium meliloti]RVN88460.1 hypothetical protein CN107_13940 [Sinorhizobium meliloti]RVO08678.1 hypothetical protein CN103_17015 [Sinorhizobium meliloti]
MNAKHLHILQHSLGLDQYGRGTFYRNHFVTGEGSKDHSDCMELVEAGFMTRRANIEIYGGMDFFCVTEAGKAAMLQHSPQPPKLTKGQQRYQDYLDADCSMSFIEYLKYRDARDRRAA